MVSFKKKIWIIDTIKTAFSTCTGSIAPGHRPDLPSLVVTSTLGNISQYRMKKQLSLYY